MPAVDSDEAALLEVLEDDINEFFLGAGIVVETAEENKRMKINVPLKTTKKDIVLTRKIGKEDKKVELKYKIRIYRR